MLSGCRAEQPPRAPAPAPTPASGPAGARPEGLVLDKAALRSAGASPKLIERVAQSPFRYFRMLAPAFEARTCSAFKDVSQRLPLMVIHGDPHLEQFVVTRETYGLEDFDRAGFGPAVVDLVRYAGSLHVACRAVGWSCDSNAAVERFLDAYRAALDASPPIGEAPTLVQRLRDRAPQGNASWLAWADGLTTPIAPRDELNAKKCWYDFAAQLAELRPDRLRAEYDVVRVGALSMGYGSAHENKVLFRIQGPTPSGEDDYVVEAREGPAPEDSSCVWRGGQGQPLILMFMSVLGRRMPDIYGFVPLRGDRSREFWVQSWDPGYRELALEDIADQKELEELAVDAARQLAGHFWSRFPEQLRLYNRSAQLKAFDLTRSRASRLARELAVESIAGWESFRWSK